MEFFIYKYIENNQVVYIGQTINLKQRIISHKYDILKDFKGDIFYTKVKSKTEMDFLERILINHYHPKYNIKDNFFNLNIELHDNSIVWEKFNEKDFTTPLKSDETHERYLKQKYYGINKEKRGRKRVDVDKNLFFELNELYENKKISAEEFYKKLGIGKTTFYKIKRSLSTYFN